MPELPEVECLRRSLATIVGRRVTRVRVFRSDVVAGESVALALLRGGRLTEPARHGKQLALGVDDGRRVVVQLGMTGALRILASREPHPDHTHVRWWLDDGRSVAYRDPRRFGRLTPHATPVAVERVWRALGADALTLTARELRRVCGSAHRAVKSLLLDQSRLAGVGNIYADEALWEARISPLASAVCLEASETRALAGAIRRVLARGIERGGSTIRDYRDALGRPGSTQLSHRVYGRGGEPCLRCGTTLARGQVAQRTTVWCPQCQLGGGSSTSVRRAEERTSDRVSGSLLS